MNVMGRPMRWARAGGNGGGPTGSLAVLAVLVAAACAPTVKIEAPDKPIEINLNVKIDQEVRIKVDRELDQAIQQNPEIF